MKGRNTFSRRQASEIRRLLTAKRRASPRKQKVIRDKIRQSGFYISDFRSGGSGFTARDFDQLVENGQITIRSDRSVTSAIRDLWHRLVEWLRDIRRHETDQTTYSARLPPLLELGLTVVFVGTEPGSRSLEANSYYAHPDNTFYGDLHQAGFVPEVLNPEDHRRLLGFGIGVDDVYDDPPALRRRLTKAAPRAVCFNSRGALERFAGAELGEWRGTAAAQYVDLPVDIVWAVPDSSPRAFRHHSERVRLLRELRRELG